MRAFEVACNGEHVTTAGVDGIGTVLATVVWHRPEPTDASGAELRVRNAGSTATEYLEWFERELYAGDVVTIRLAHVDHVTAATAVSSRAPETQEEYAAKLRARAEQILRELDG